jgi:hypothetical protein
MVSSPNLRWGFSDDAVQDLEADLVLWTAGSQPSSKASPGMQLPFPLTDKGAMRTDDTLQVVPQLYRLLPFTIFPPTSGLSATVALPKLLSISAA